MDVVDDDEAEKELNEEEGQEQEGDEARMMQRQRLQKSQSLPQRDQARNTSNHEQRLRFHSRHRGPSLFPP